MVSSSGVPKRMYAFCASTRHLLPMMILFGVRYFAPKWQKIPAGVYPRLMQIENPAHFYHGNQKSFHPDMAIVSYHSKLR